jgi:hypothetical protein
LSEAALQVPSVALGRKLKWPPVSSPFGIEPYVPDGLSKRKTSTNFPLAPRAPSLVITVAARGLVAGRMSVAARVVRPGLRGAVEAIRDLVPRRGPDDRHYPISFNIPHAETNSSLRRFLRVD